MSEVSGVIDKKRQNKKKRKGQLGILLVLAAVFLLCHITTGGRLLTPGNIQNILVHAVYPGLAALGMMFIFAGGIIDLSIGAAVILSANIGAVLVEDYGFGYVGLILGTIIGLVICQMITLQCSLTLKIPAWISGLGMALIYEAAFTIYATERSKTAGNNIVYLKSCRALGQFPAIFIIAVLVFIVAFILYEYSTTGMNVRAVGGNASVAEAMGINRRKAIIKSAAIGAIIIGIGALLQVSYVGKFSPVSGLGSLSGIFKSLACVLLAGSLKRVFCEPAGVAIGAIFIAGLFNVLTLLGVPSGTGQEMCLGVIVILCGVLSNRGYKGVMK